MELLHGGMVLSSAWGLGCSTLLDKRARFTAIAAGVVMFAAMLDMSAGHMALAPTSWAALLILTAIATTTVQLGLQPSQPTMALHRGLGAVVVAALLLVTHPVSGLSLLPGSHAMAGMRADATMTSGTPHPGLSVGAGIIAVLYVGTSAVLAVRHARAAGTTDPSSRPDPSTRRARVAALLDVAAMAACVVFMGIDALG